MSKPKWDSPAKRAALHAPSLFSSLFDGATIEPEKDEQRLSEQHQRVQKLMRDGRWRTLAEIAAETNDPEASISARLRDFRKPRFGGYTVERRRRPVGTFEYRLETGAR